MTNQFADILGDAAADRLPRDAVFAIFSLTSLRFVTLLTPIALFLGVMLALARLNRDCEMAALSACGVGPGRLLVPILTLTGRARGRADLARVVPDARGEQPDRGDQVPRRARHEARRARGGQVHEPGLRGHVLYAREVVGDELRDVFVQHQRATASWRRSPIAASASWIPRRARSPSCCTTAGATKACRVATSSSWSSSMKAKFRFGLRKKRVRGDRGSKSSGRCSLRRGPRIEPSSSGGSRCRYRCSFWRCSPFR